MASAKRSGLQQQRRPDVREHLFNMYTYNIVHIHTDRKFLYDVRKYKDRSSRLQNEIIFFGDLDERDLDLLHELCLSYHVFPKDIHSIYRAESLIFGADGVVLNGLCSFKEHLLKMIPDSITVFLRFFGYEIYGQLKSNYMSRVTINALYPIRVGLPVDRFVKNIVNRILLRRKKSRISGKKKNVYKNIDAIFLFSREEYDELGAFLTLPPLIHLPIFHREETGYFADIKKDNLIILGNSRIAWNNHLDVLQKLQGISGQHDYNILMFFSYGANGAYAAKVRKRVDSLYRFTLLEEFMDPAQFCDTYRNASALVINSYRQHALGNVFTGIRYGCKIYLNENSSTYSWLRNSGFLISNVDELTRDMTAKMTYLTLEEQKHNLKRLQELQNLYTPDAFVSEIIRLLEKKTE